MTLKNVKKSNFAIRLKNGLAVDSNYKLIEETDSDIQEKEIRRCCRQIARGVLLRLNIQAEEKSLTLIFENFEARNNLVATTDWIYKLGLGEVEVSAKIISELSIQLRELIFEYMES